MITHVTTLMRRIVILYIIIVILLIGSIVFLKKGHDKLDETKSLIKIMGGLVCTVIAGCILLEVDYIV